MKLTHKQKVKKARRMSGRMTGHFVSPEWKRRKLYLFLKKVLKVL